MPDGRLKKAVLDKRGVYQLGLQGPDIFFYNLPMLRFSDCRNVGSVMHDHRVNRFFQCYLAAMDGLAVSDPDESECAEAYLAGYISHYIADSIIHPYIYGRINYNPEIDEKLYMGVHGQLESDIDAILLMKFEHLKPSEFSRADTVEFDGKDLGFLSEFLAECINKTFYSDLPGKGYHITAADVSRSVRSVRIENRLLADRKGIKKSIVSKLERIYPGYPIVSGMFTTDTIVNSETKALNLDHEQWVDPWDTSIRSSASLPDLYKETVKKTDEVMTLTAELFETGLPLADEDKIVLLDELGNRSFHSGLDVKDF